jgi:conjugal transfer pilus assembly protein TraV
MSARGIPFAAGLVSLLALGGCASLTGNVKGSFSCSAPDGICAPSSLIDDRALAMITGEAGAPGMAPAGPYRGDGEVQLRRTKSASARDERTPIAAADTARTQDKVLRIVFQPYVDAYGRLHEASAVHAVVQRAEWQQQARAQATALPAALSAAIPTRTASAATPGALSLAEAVEEADGAALAATIDPDLPDPARVEAARARKVDPIGAIKSDVAAKLATPKRAQEKQPAQAAPPLSARKTDAVAEPLVVPAAKSSLVPVSPNTTATAPQPSVRLPAPPARAKTTSGAEAEARIKSDPRYTAVSKTAQENARQAAEQADVPDLAPVRKPTVRATAFPGITSEDE